MSTENQRDPMEKITVIPSFFWHLLHICDGVNIDGVHRLACGVNRVYVAKLKYIACNICMLTAHSKWDEIYVYQNLFGYNILTCILSPFEDT